MALNDMQRMENVFGSIRKYAKAKLVTSEGIAVSLDELLDVDPSGEDEWLELRIKRMPKVQAFRNCGTNLRGADARVLVQINVYVRKTEVALNYNTRRSQELVDIIDQYFHEGSVVTVYQLQSGGTPATSVGTLKVIEDNIVDLGEVQRSTASSTMVVLWRAYEATFKWDRLIATN